MRQQLKCYKQSISLDRSFANDQFRVSGILIPIRNDRALNPTSVTGPRVRSNFPPQSQEGTASPLENRACNLRLSYKKMGQTDRITIEKLKGSSDYPSWKRNCKAILTREDYEEAIERDLSTSKDLDLKRKNSKAMASILLFCTDEVQIQISEYTSAFLAWQALDRTYNRSRFIAVYVLLKQFFSTSLDQFQTIEAFLYKIRNLRSELENHGIRLPEQVVIS